MPYWKNRVLKSCLAGGVLTALLLLAVLPSTRAWYTSRETGEGSTIMTADVFPLPPETNTKSVTLPPVYTYALNGEANGTESMVIRRVLRFEMVRVAITAGTLQPKPIIIGINDLPCIPIRAKRGSASIAARAK